MYLKNLLFFFPLLLISAAASAMPPATDSLKIKIHPPVEQFYIGNSFDAGIFSTANIQRTVPAITPGGGNNTYTYNATSAVRFTYVINYGVSFNFNLSRHFGIFTGVDLKNIGFIEKNYNGNETVKRRTYNLGAPLGIKIGNLKRKGMYLFLGGGLDLPINYKEKEFVERTNKTKFNEWFSSRTPTVMPYVFAGIKIKNGVTFKLQYYPNNFLNPDYTASGGIKPYAGYNVHVTMLSLGYDMHFGKHKDMVKTNVTKLSTNTL